LPKENQPDIKSIFLVEHGNGYCCCYLHFPGKNGIGLAYATFFPPAREAYLQKKARVLGMLDLEIRCLLKPERGFLRETPELRPVSDLASSAMNLSTLLRLARRRSGLSFREASAVTRDVAAELGNEHYFISPGSMSDYEAINTLPRHIHKVISLCIVYGITFAEFLASAGLSLDGTGGGTIPDVLVSREVSGSRGRRASDSAKPGANGFLERLSGRLRPAPLFLRRSWVDFSGLKRPTLNDVFWLGGIPNSIQPFENTILAVVNRHKKRPVYFPSREWWQQPLYLVLKRNGTCVAGCCSLENNALVIREYAANRWHVSHIESRHDAEVIGQIVTIVRKL
jgi:hypothetical protein